jgi:nuclear GTP-binding protein
MHISLQCMPFALSGTCDMQHSSIAAFDPSSPVVLAQHLPPLQVLDARDPAGCRCPDVERYVRSLDPNKRVILLLNKMGEATGAVH